MKKTLLTLVAATAMIIGLAGCDALTGGKFNSDSLDNDSKDWASESKQTKKADEVMKVVIADTAEIKLDSSWWVWTDEKGIVLPTQPTGAAGKEGYEFTFTEAIINQVDYNESAGSERFVLYTTLNGTDKKVGDLKDYDVRGRICVYKDRIVNVKIAKYPEVISKVGIVTIKNDEPVAKSTFKDGDYTINAIYPLNPKTDDADTAEKLANDKLGGTYVVEDTMCFEKLSVAKDEEISFPVKAGSQIIGLYQEKRSANFKASTDESYTGPTTRKQIAEDTYVTIDGVNLTRADVLDLDIKDSDTDEQIVKKYVDANKKLIFGEKMTIEIHKENKTAIKSSTFNTYWFAKKSSKILRTKTAGEAEEVVVYTAPIEK